ncbi:MAG: InlB B-repeat-containing protein, partial [Firmicutes bacterium]|nr:InlB B-repeat-containing protein [Bacillota bacterium]
MRNTFIRLSGLFLLFFILISITGISAEPAWADTAPNFSVQPNTIYVPEGGTAELTFSLNVDPEQRDDISLELYNNTFNHLYDIESRFTDPEGNPAAPKQNMTVVVDDSWISEYPYTIELNWVADGNRCRQSEEFYINPEPKFLQQPNTISLDTSDPDAEKKLTFALNFETHGERFWILDDMDGELTNHTFEEVTRWLTQSRRTYSIYMGTDAISEYPFYVVLQGKNGEEYYSEPFYILPKGTNMFTRQPQDVVILDGQLEWVTWSVDREIEPISITWENQNDSCFFISGGPMGYDSSSSNRFPDAYGQICGNGQNVEIEEAQDMHIWVTSDWVSDVPYQLCLIDYPWVLTERTNVYSRYFYVRAAYTVRCHMGSAYSRPDTSQQVLAGEKAVAPEMPEEINGYVFGGWYTDPGFNSPFNFSTPITGTLDLYAKWNLKSYGVDFDTVGGSPNPQSQIITHGGKVTKPADPVKAGGSFMGWYTDPGYEHVYDFSRAVTDDLILYAKWEMQTFLVSFNNRGIGTRPPVQTVTYGAIAVEPKKLYQNGYIFGGWYTNGGFTEDHHFDFSTPITQHTNLNAKWTKLCTVTFKPGEGSGTMTGRRPPAGSVLTVPESTFAAPEGKRFRYWVCGGTYYSAGRAITVYDDMAFTAVWEVIPYRTITFDMNGRGAPIDPAQVELNTVPTPPADPAGDGSWEFTGWYTNRQAANMSSAAYLFDFTQPLTDNKTLYAGWRDNTAYKIKLVFAGQGVGTAWLENDTEDFVNQSEDVYYAHPGDRIYIRDITPGVDSTFWKTEYYYYDVVNSQSRTVDISGTSYYFMPSSEVEVTVYFNSTGAHTHDASTLTHVDA